MRILLDNFVEGEHGRVLQGVVSRASFRRAASSGQTVFTVLSLHINNVFAKKRGIAKKIIQVVRALMISQNIDLIAGDFNGAAWRCRSRDNFRSIDEVFSDYALQTPPGPPPLRRPGSIPDNWTDVCGFLKPPGSQKFWKVSKHGAFSILRQALGLRANDQSCHHETWLHLYFVDWSNLWNHQARYNGNSRLTERPANSRNRAPKSHLRGIERPLALITAVRPFVLGILLPTLSDHSFDEIHVFFITK